MVVSANVVNPGAGDSALKLNVFTMRVQRKELLMMVVSGQEKSQNLKCLEGGLAFESFSCDHD